MHLEIGAHLGRYEIRSLLGQGGMGEVYLAYDNRLRRPVALKLLSDSGYNKDKLLRFEQEAYVVSALNHPNILTIYEIGTTIGPVEELPFIATEFVDGVTLRQRLLTTQVELKEALDIAVQVASALAAAHQARIVHRDIKPENIMIRPDGYVKVLDFGLAKLTELQDRGSEDQTMRVKTEPGLLVGTIKHMSPEQARGLEVDERTDIWGLGVVLFEMVSGRTPFEGSTKTDVIASILKTEPLPLSRLAPGVPAELQRIVRKTLRKDTKERYQSAKDLMLDLKSLLNEIDSSDMNSGIEQQPSSVAILPFRNLTNDPAVSFYEFALADAVITELVRLRSLIVRPSSAIARYLDHAKDPLEAGQDLKVDAILAASFLHAGSRVRVTAQLLDVVNGNVLWGDRIDSDANDIITVQDIIAKRIVEGLQLKLSSHELISLAGHGSANFLAYQEYLKGRDRVGRFMYHTVAEEDLDAAVKHFQRAIELDATFALAYCALGSCYMQRIMKGGGKFNDVLQARDAFDKGLAIDPEIIEARAYMVYVFAFQGEKQKAQNQIARLRLEAPNDARVQYVSGVMHRIAGEYDKALKSYDRSSELNPVERLVVSWGRARIFMYQGRYDEALSELDYASALEPKHPLLNSFRAQVLLLRGDPAAASELLQEVLLSHPQIDGVRPLLAQSLSALGKHEAARAQLTERVKEVASIDHDVPYWLATAYAMEGEQEEALLWLEKAISLGNENLPWFKTNPAWQSLRDDVRFQRLMNGLEVGRERGA
jgi:eukaryotic-like serine/threonine-protein kinase